MVYACLGQEGTPADTVGSSYICTRIVPHHEEAALPVELCHVVLHELEGSLLRLSEIALVELKLMAAAVFFQHVVERSEGQSRSVVATCPNDIILCCEVRWKRKASLLFFGKDVVDDFESGLVGTDIIEGKDGVDDLSPFVVVGR